MNAHQERLERFLRESPWEYEAVKTHLRNAAPEAVQGTGTALIVDGMGIPKKGNHSVGVYRQWCGATGKLDNCQVTVNCTLARPGDGYNSDTITWPLGMRLYLPKKWAGEDDSVYDNQAEREDYARRREKAEIPEEVGYQPKYGIAINQIEAAIEASIEHACVIADTNYGMRSPFRKQLRSLNESYVLDIETDRLYVVPEDADIIEPGQTSGPGAPRTHRTVPDEFEMETAVDVAERVTDDAWTAVVWNEGTKESLTGLFYRDRIQVVSNASGSIARMIAIASSSSAWRV
ncbi:MAG: IS701 family transposase [Halodesulfurarchaeum sp.]